MKTEMYSDYICYDINFYYDKNPYGPNRCPMCAGDLSQAEMEPSKAARDAIIQFERREVYVNSRATFLHICNKCRWWCIRDACEFVDTRVAVRHHCDYLIFAIAKKNESKVFGDTLESTQPWFKALDDLDVYDKDVVRHLPKELAVFIYKQPDLPGSILVSQQVIKNLSRYDPFVGQTKYLIAKKRRKRLSKTDPVILNPGDKVCITDHIYSIKNEIDSNTIIATRGSIGTVLSWDEYCGGAIRKKSKKVKRWMNKGTRYPVRLETIAPPSGDELAFWDKLFQQTFVERTIRKIRILEIDYLEKMTG